MKVSCPSCQTHYNIDDKRIPAGGAKLKCAKCQTTFPIKGSAPSTGALPLPGASSPGSTARPAARSNPSPATASAIPLPGGAGPTASSSAASSAIPLPGAAPVGGAARWEDAPAPASAGLPCPAQAGSWEGAPAPEAAGPLPGAAAPNGFSGSDVSTGSDAPPPAWGSLDEEGPAQNDPLNGFEGEAVPLPGAPASGGWEDDRPAAAGTAGWESAAPPPEEDLVSGWDAPPQPLPPAEDAGGWEADAALPLPGGPEASASDNPNAIPLPGQSEGGWEPAEPAPVAQGDASPPPEEASWEEEATKVHRLPIPVAAFLGGPESPSAKMKSEAVPAMPSFDFADLPSPAGVAPAEDSFSFDEPAPRAADSFELEDLPSPVESRPEPLPDFELAAPEAAPSESFELDDLPSPVEADLPSPAGASADFDELLPTPGQAPVEDFSIGFDDATAASPSAAPSETSPDLGEVELGGSAPDMLSFDVDPEAAPADGSGDALEMLDFVDDSAPGAAENGTGEASRFHIRRRSGKVFGPFDLGVIVKMLEDGQLLGNEDVSADSTTWAPIGTVPAFTGAIQRLMESPAQSSRAPDAAPLVDASAEPVSPSMNRMKQLYEGRMAAVSVVDPRSQRAPFKLPVKLPVLIAAAVGLVVLGTGAYLGTTRYGVFGLKLLIPSKVNPGTREFADLQLAQKSLLSDTFKGYRDARDAAGRALSTKEYPEARAIWCQAIFYLQRRFAAASPAELATAIDSLPKIELLGKKHPEVVKAQAGEALVRRDASAALVLLDDAAARAENAGDLELTFLRAEAYALKGQPKLAAQALEKVRSQSHDKGLAKALHALGDLHQANKEADLAATSYEQALAADPNHISSALELAAIELLIRKDAQKGTAAIDQALTEDRRPLLGPAELARAEALKGAALAMTGKPDEAAASLERALKLDPTSSYAKATLAQLERTRGALDKALPLYKDAAAREPTNLEYTEGYLSALVASGKMADALKEVAAANSRFPGNPRLAYLAGQVSEGLAKNKEAESNYLRAANGDPKGVDANLALARLYVASRRMADAKQQLALAVQKAPESAAVHSGRAELDLNDGALDSAASNFSLAIEKDPRFAPAHLGLGQVALVKGELDKAASEIEKALALEPHVKGGHLQKGLLLFKLGKLDPAIAELQIARTDDPKSARAATSLGAVQLAKGDLVGAEGSEQAAVSLEPTLADAHFYLAQVKSKRGEHPQAIEVMRRAVALAPKRADFHFQMGAVLREAKKMPDALEEWKLALELAPKHADTLEALGQAALDRGDSEGAAKFFEQALAAEPGRTREIALIGDCYFQSAKWKEAIAHYQKALQIDPSLKQVYYKVARAYSEKSQGADAITWYRKATEIDRDNPMPYYYLGFAFKESGKKKDAVVAFKSYLVRRPDADDKKEIEDEIYDLENEANPRPEP